jgi:hypothetical protein
MGAPARPSFRIEEYIVAWSPRERGAAGHRDQTMADPRVPAKSILDLMISLCSGCHAKIRKGNLMLVCRTRKRHLIALSIFLCLSQSSANTS